MRVLQLREYPDLAKEAFGAQGGAYSWSQNLERKGAIVLEVMHEIHRRRGTSADLTFDPVFAGQRDLDALGVFGHGGWKYGDLSEDNQESGIGNRESGIRVVYWTSPV